MRLLELTYKDLKTGWNIKDVRFGSLSLFVGASGAGKTKILNTIMTLVDIASGESYDGVSWCVVFMENGRKYTWQGEFASAVDDDKLVIESKPVVKVLKESLVVDADEEIFRRDADGLWYHGLATVKLDPTESGVELLKAEEDVLPVYEGFKKILMLDMSVGGGLRLQPSFLDSDKASLSIAEIKSKAAFAPIDKLFLLSRYHHDLFEEIQETFQGIFPNVENIDFTLFRTSAPSLFPVLKIKERGVDEWIPQGEISNGMMRSLNQIITLALAEDGEVILIDEFENGLGINCIEILAEMAVEPDVRVQIIMTSHHPYIINAIPFKDWRIVTRNGSDVKVHTADELRIGVKSKHEAFMQLLQTEEFTTGQS